MHSPTTHSEREEKERKVVYSKREGGGKEKREGEEGKRERGREIYIYTVESLLTDTPNSGHLPNNGRWYMHRLTSPYIYYDSNTRIADNHRIPNNGHGVPHAVIKIHAKVLR